MKACVAPPVDWFAPSDSRLSPGSRPTTFLNANGMPWAEEGHSQAFGADYRRGTPLATTC